MTSASAASAAAMCVMAASPAAEGADDLDLVAGGERKLGPGARRCHDPIHRDGDAAAPFDAARAQQLGDIGRGQRFLAAVDPDACAHASSFPGPAKRSMANGRIVSSTSPLRMNRLTAAAVTGVSRMPLR